MRPPPAGGGYPPEIAAKDYEDEASMRPPPAGGGYGALAKRVAPMGPAGVCENLGQ